jgi:hypothetical protein
MMETKFAEYLDDGLYASYDNGYVILSTGSHITLHANQVIYLDPQTIVKLMDYLSALPEKIKEQTSKT